MDAYVHKVQRKFDDFTGPARVARRTRPAAASKDARLLRNDRVSEDVCIGRAVHELRLEADAQLDVFQGGA